MERRLFNSHSKVLSSICARRRWPLMSLTVNVRIPSRYSIYSKDIIHYLKWFCWDDATPKINCQFYLISPTTDQRNCYFYPESWNIQIVQLIKTIVPYNNCPIVYRTRWSLCWAQNTENSRTIKFSIAALDKWQMWNCYWILVYSFKKRIQNETVFSSTCWGIFIVFPCSLRALLECLPYSCGRWSATCCTCNFHWFLKQRSD